jgi:hypothetical protein
VAVVVMAVVVAVVVMAVVAVVPAVVAAVMAVVPAVTPMVTRRQGAGLGLRNGGMPCFWRGDASLSKGRGTGEQCAGRGSGHQGGGSAFCNSHVVSLSPGMARDAQITTLSWFATVPVSRSDHVAPQCEGKLLIKLTFPE